MFARLGPDDTTPGSYPRRQQHVRAKVPDFAQAVPNEEATYAHIPLKVIIINDDLKRDSGIGPVAITHVWRTQLVLQRKIRGLKALD